MLRLVVIVIIVQRYSIEISHLLCSSLSKVCCGAENPMAVACVRKYSGVCSKLTGRDLDEVEKLCEVSCRFLRDNAEEFIHQRHDTPILVLYGNDATPSQTMVSIRCGSEGLAKTFYRRGRDTKDLLAEKLFLTDGVSAMVVFADPQ